MHWMVMGSSTSLLLIGGNVLKLCQLPEGPGEPALTASHPGCMCPSHSALCGVQIFTLGFALTGCFCHCTDVYRYKYQQSVRRDGCYFVWQVLGKGKEEKNAQRERERESVCVWMCVCVCGGGSGCVCVCVCVRACVRACVFLLLPFLFKSFHISDIRLILQLPF